MLKKRSVVDIVIFEDEVSRFKNVLGTITIVKNPASGFYSLKVESLQPVLRSFVIQVRRVNERPRVHHRSITAIA